MIPYFTLQDISGSLLAFSLFPLVFAFPGYVFAHTLNLFIFRKRRLLARLAIAVMISTAISPILFFLAYRLGSSVFAFVLIALFVAVFAAIFWQERKTAQGTWGEVGNGPTLAVWILGGWSLFAILSLVDIQLGDRLYYSVVSYDLTSRVSITSAITRTGVPPINPGYFAGEYVHLTFLYYFWYILCSLIDQIGGRWVDARLAMIASVAWCGVALMATVSLYLRLRNPWSGARAWKSALLGIGALTISGLDIIPVLKIMIFSRLTYGRMAPAGDIEHWNDQITAWLGAVSWVPHHVAGLIACIAGFLLIQSVRGKHIKTQVAAAGVAGLSLASASGLSIYVTGVFVIFWAAWMLYLLLEKKEYRTVSMMMLAGIFSLIAAGPYLSDLLHGGGGASSPEGSLPIAFHVRIFGMLLPLLSSYSVAVKNLLYLAVLPLNYFMELGFYFVVGFLWLRKNIKTARTGNAFYMSEILLLGASFLVASFFRSTVIAANDLGWRGWMFGQFVLLIWAVDIGQEFLYKNSAISYFSTESRMQIVKNEKVLVCLMVIGMLTSIFSLSLLRFWPILVDTGFTGVPTGLSPDTHLGNRTFAARQAYEYIRDSLPKDVIVQYNPLLSADRPSGLYGTRQMAAADHSAYGVPQEAFQSLQRDIGSIFQNAGNGWPGIDQNCRRHAIDVIIPYDLDPLWQDMPDMMQQRRPLYRNSYYAVFACGDFADRSSLADKSPP
jgi:hypothetical protein